MGEMPLLNKYDFVPFKEIPKPKYPEGFITHYLIDDMLGTNIFKHGRSVFTNICIRNRNVTPSNVLISTQSTHEDTRPPQQQLNGGNSYTMARAYSSQTQRQSP